MKNFVRHPRVQRAISRTVSTYLRFVYATLRWTKVEHERAEKIWADSGPSGPILCVWHSLVPVAPCSWDLKAGAQDLRVLISRSADGELIAQVMEDCGFPSIRGSRRNPNAIEDKGGATAFRDMLRWLRGGGAIAITPDGPKGPARIMGEGTPNLARLSGAPVLFVGIACKPCLRAKSWDRTVFPLPFGRAAMVWDGPAYALKGDDPDQLAIAWAERLSAVTDRAEDLLK